MTEQDERTIYEWAYPDRAKRQGGFRTNPYSWRKQEWDNVNCLWRDLATLDMNFAADVCTPKLRKERFQVDMWTHESTDKPFGVRIHGYSADTSFQAFVKFSDESLREAFYSALLAYIKGVK
jgi:hypothetical protein